MKNGDFALKNTDNNTSEKILADYPADWDMDGVFEKSYRKFQKMSGEVPAAGDTLEYSEAEVINRKRIRIFTPERIAAAACITLVAALFGSLYLMPDNENITPDNVQNMPVVTTSEQTTEVTAATSASASQTAKTTVVTSQVTTEMTVLTTETAAEKTVSAETTAPVKTTVPVTTAEPETTVPETTTKPYYGHFQINEGAYKGTSDFDDMDELLYIRNEDIPIVPREHMTGLGDEYRVEKIEEGNWWWSDEFYEGYIVGTEDDPLMLIAFFEYKNVRGGLNRKLYTDIEETEVNGRPALIFTADPEKNSNFNSLGFILIFDDGCHICMVAVKEPGEIVNKENIIEFAEKL